MKNNYSDFFEHILKFKEKQTKQKQRGLNDFNLLSTVRKYHDEVYLHSTMIGALLSPDGLHYQDTLFLEKFMDVLNLDNFKLNLSNTTVGVEYQDIDLYITDGIKHIIIENKVFAEDQPCQIIKYINIIKEENDLKSDDNKIPKIEDIYVIYLTPNDKKVSHEHIVSNGYITFSGSKEKLNNCSNRENTKKLVPNGLKNYQTKYKKITYKKEILEWLFSSQKEIENITNLNEAIKQYIDVVKMINNDYKGKVMELSEELAKEGNFKIAYDIHNEFPITCAKIENNFWNTLINKIKHIDGYKGIVNEQDKTIQEYMNENIILNIRNSKNNSSGVNIYFELITGISIIIGTDNKSNKIYTVVFKSNKKDSILWEKINPNDDSEIIKIINNISGYDFEYKNWCYATGILDDTINLRDDTLIKAYDKIDTLSVKIKDLIKDLKLALKDIN